MQNLTSRSRFIKSISGNFLFARRRRVHLSRSTPQVNLVQISDKEVAVRVQSVLKANRKSSIETVEIALFNCIPAFSENLVVEVLKRHRSDWESALVFFKWASKRDEFPQFGAHVHNEILDILGKMRRFDELLQLLEGMSERKIADEETYRILVHRYAAADRIDDAIKAFDRREELGLHLDLASFQKLLLHLCRYDHVDIAETLLHERGRQFGINIKTLNIVLNGWCVAGKVHEAKRFWRDIIVSKCTPDLYTYSTFIHALSKKGKLGTALKLFNVMKEKGPKPDVVICNCVIDALCFKKRVPEAFEIFHEMKDRGCPLNVATYNTFIKKLCRIQRMDKVHEMLDEMIERNGGCAPNHITFTYLLKSSKKPDEIAMVLAKMNMIGCRMNADMYNVILKLYACWKCEEEMKQTWEEMENAGMGPDHRSYSIMIHWLHERGKGDGALRYFEEMVSKGMAPGAKTEILINSLKIKGDSYVQYRRDHS